MIATKDNLRVVPVGGSGDYKDWMGYHFYWGDAYDVNRYAIGVIPFPTRAACHAYESAVSEAIILCTDTHDALDRFARWYAAAVLAARYRLDRVVPAGTIAAWAAPIRATMTPTEWRVVCRAARERLAARTDETVGRTAPR